MTNSEVGQRLRHIRREMYLTQGEVGDRLIPRRSYAAISDMERGKTEITVHTVFQYARLLPCSVEWLMTGVERGEMTLRGRYEP